MIRLILIVVVLSFTLMTGIAVGLYHYFGAKGLIALPVIVLVGGWIAKKIIGSVIKKFALGLFGMKSGVLKGAAVNIHSVTPIAKPIEREVEADEMDGAGASGEMDVDDSSDEDAADEPELDEPKNYYEVDLTITPKAEAGDGVWEPTEILLASQKVSSIEEMEDKQVGFVHEVKVWDGTAFGPDDPGKYPGEQRLLVTLAVDPGTQRAWLQYYNESLGEMELPEWRVDAVRAV